MTLAVFAADYPVSISLTAKNICWSFSVLSQLSKFWIVKLSISLFNGEKSFKNLFLPLKRQFERFSGAFSCRISAFLSLKKGSNDFWAQIDFNRFLPVLLDILRFRTDQKVTFCFFEPCLSCWEHWRQRLRFQYAALSDFFRNFSIFFDFGWRFFLFSSSVLIHINTRIHIIWWDFWAPCERVMINGPITAEKGAHFARGYLAFSRL